MKREFQSLRELREKLLGYSLGFAARKSGLAQDRLEAIESGEPAALWELERLAGIFGLDPDLLEEEPPIKISRGDAIGVLMSLDEFRDVGDETRLRVVQAASAARDLTTLQRNDRWTEFKQSVPRLRLKSKADAPHRMGAQLAGQLRRELGLAEQPIASMRDFVTQNFPSVSVLHSDLGNEGPAGLSFGDTVRGPTIVLNTSGKNLNACVRRFSLAHELCHLLYDWNRQQPIAMMSGYLTDGALDVERRANAFAVRLICPEAVLRKIDAKSSDDEIADVLRPYGLPYRAALLYLRNEAPDLVSPQISDLGTGDSRWSDAEEPYGLEDFPVVGVPSERRTLVARAAAEAYSSGRTSRDRFCEYLGVTATEDVERVLDFFLLSRPGEELGASA